MNTETIESVAKRLRFVIGSGVSNVSSFVEGAKYQKEQDEARFKKLQNELLECKKELAQSYIDHNKDLDKSINNLDKHIQDIDKYKELVNNHNELLIAIENPTAYNLANPYRLQDLINKAKNI